VSRLAAALAILVAGCRQAPSEPAELVDAPRWLAAPSERDLGVRCIDVGEQRACFGDRPGAVHGVSSVPRPLPEQRAPLRGWRCSGSARARVCEDRAFGSDAFECGAQQCTQRHPRMPDDGEWECADIEGAVICRGGGAAAGVVSGPPDPAWQCGARRGAVGERICVDFSPDRPPNEALGDCRFIHEPGRPSRICSPGRAALGQPCDASACPAGLVCAGGHCLPLDPAPSCWIDRDCGSGACLFGSCRGGG
jgi:hypothetical protein